jgi:hypothetical protein
VASRLVRATSLLISGLIALTLTAGPLGAGQDEPLSLRYGVYWAGFQIATLTLDHRVDSSHYRSELLVKSVGLVEKLAHYRSKTFAVGQLGADDSLTPITFSTQYSTRKKDRRSVVRFDRESGDVVDLEMTKRGKPDTSDVPGALRKDVIDPLSAFFQLRDYVATAGATAPFAAAVFDGRRRYDVEAQVTGHDRTWVAGRERSVVRVRLKLTLLAGADLDEIDLGDNNQVGIELLLSDDQRLLPLEMRLLDATPGASIELLQDCSGETGCQLAAR